MVVNDVVELGLTCRLTAGCLMWALHQLNREPFEFWLENVDYKLRRARAPWPVNPPADLPSSSGLVEVSGLNEAPHASSDEE